MPTGPGGGVGDGAAASRGQAVLVVDDEPLIRAVARKALEKFGMPVLLAADGSEAIAVCREHGERIGCVLLDLAMPGLSGEETIDGLRTVCDGVPVVLMSGYDQQRLTLGGHELAAFLHKPFELDELRRVVETVLQGA